MYKMALVAVTPREGSPGCQPPPAARHHGLLGDESSLTAAHGWAVPTTSGRSKEQQARPRPPGRGSTLLPGKDRLSSPRAGLGSDVSFFCPLYYIGWNQVGLREIMTFPRPRSSSLWDSVTCLQARSKSHCISGPPGLCLSEPLSKRAVQLCGRPTRLPRSVLPVPPGALGLEAP